MALTLKQYLKQLDKDTLKKIFDEAELTELEYWLLTYAYMVNAEYADHGKLSERQDYYKQMAKDDLHNDSFPERGEERAYYDAMRRSRRYNNRYDEPVRYEYNNRYDYNNNYNYNNRRYNERGYDGRADRDNDGRYNEGR